MFSKSKSILLFIFACIPIRIAIAAIPLYINIQFLPYYGFGLLLLAIGFLYMYFNNLRLHAIEAGGTTWWSEYRLLHGIFYLAAATYSLQEKRIAWIPLSLDVTLGASLFIYHRLILQ
jgi:hypothetical protein